MDTVQRTFREIAERYDQYRRKLIPCFDDFYRAVVAMTAFPPEQSFAVLDLGAGTGLLTQFLSEAFPKAYFTLMDFTAEMLEKARQRFGADPRFAYQIADYATADWGENFDLIVSSLSIHHLADPEKQGLYRKIFAQLKPGGQFINAEFVAGSSPELHRHYWQLWLKFMAQAGLNQAEIEQAIERTKIDILAPVELQLEWLRESGFRDVGCHYRQYLFAVFGGAKIGSF